MIDVVYKRKRSKTPVRQRQNTASYMLTSIKIMIAFTNAIKDEEEDLADVATWLLGM